MDFIDKCQLNIWELFCLRGKKTNNLSQCGKTFHGSKHIFKPLLLTVNNPVEVNWSYLFFSSD